ncbi:MAG: class A beta-lactamase-related serine hydrolase, partial [Ignavibacteriaceae bacterium]|nr:class A beta-lactamase-related serine hydrolase [Ignavibacteriaceae bacterium]
MKKLLLFLLLSSSAFAQNTKVPDYYQTDKNLDEQINNIIRELKLDGNFDVGEDGIEKISFAVIDLNQSEPVLSGYNYTNFIYPASVYKMYVAAEVLHQISEGKHKLSEPFVVHTPNDVDKSKEISFDPRPLLNDGDTVTINYLLDLMITRSDNSAANCLIDIATRPAINKMIEENYWQGSEVTRKFLSRKFEDPDYKKIKGTETSALHAADFMYKIEKNELINPWVSMQLKVLLGRQLDKSKAAQGLPNYAMYYNKTGWWSYWTNDVGIVDDGRIK